MPQLYVNVDRDKALKEGVELTEVYKTLQTFMGGYFIDYFNRFGRQWQVYVQAEGDYRTRAENLGLFYVRNHDGEAVPMAALTSTKSISGPEFTMRYNLYRSAQINGSAAPGYSSAQANKALEEVFAQTMPPEMGYDYLGISFQEKKAEQGVPPIAIFGLSFLFVFLILAALYESWSLPFSVLLGTPIAVFGRVRGPLVPAHGKQRVCSDWSGHADRISGQKRDPDRRVRTTRIRKGQAADRSRADRRAHPIAADSHDLLRFHSRDRPVMDRHRSRCGVPAYHWDRRNRRHARGHLHRRMLDSRHILCR